MIEIDLNYHTRVMHLFYYPIAFRFPHICVSFGFQWIFHVYKLIHHHKCLLSCNGPVDIWDNSIHIIQLFLFFFILSSFFHHWFMLTCVCYTLLLERMLIISPWYLSVEYCGNTSYHIKSTSSDCQLSLILRIFRCHHISVHCILNEW